MGFLTVLFFGLLVIGGSLIDSPKDNQVKTKIIEVVANKSIETKAPIKEITPEAVKEEVTPEAVKEEVTPEAVKEEVTPEAVKEEVTPEAVKEEVKKSDSLEDSKTNYWRLVLYIIGGILLVLTGMYFFSRKRNSTQSSIQPETTEQQPVEEEIQPETTEQQPVEEEIQPETTEQQPVEEDENNKK